MEYVKDHEDECGQKVPKDQEDEHGQEESEDEGDNSTEHSAISRSALISPISIFQYKIFWNGGSGFEEEQMFFILCLHYYRHSGTGIIRKITSRGLHIGFEILAHEHSYENGSLAKKLGKQIQPNGSS